MQITLLLPELIWPEPDDRDTFATLNCPTLETLIACGRRSTRPAQSLEATLTDTFGHPEGAPYAAFRHLGETTARAAPDADQGTWLNADPVHLRFHQNLLILADAGSFSLELEEARALADTLNEQLAESGRFHVADAQRWYFQPVDTRGLEGFDTPPLSAVAGRAVERLTPDSAATRGIRQMLNEAQMVLYNHPVNERREAMGKVPINGLWLWGAGQLPARRESRFDGVWSGDPLARGLARAAGVPTHAQALEAATLLEQAAPDTHHLVLLDDLLKPVHYEDSSDYCRALGELETRWFAPLGAALKRGKLSRLRIEAPTAYALLAWESVRGDLWKFWRRGRPLGEVANTLAKSETNNAAKASPVDGPSTRGAANVQNKENG